MKKGKVILSKSAIFSKKQYKKKVLDEKKKIKNKEDELKKIYAEEKKKRKLLSKLRKKREKEIRQIQNEEKKRLKKNLKPIFKKPTISELEKYLFKISEEYDVSIKKSRKLYDELKYLGLTTSGLKEFNGETQKQKNKRIKKINEIHKTLMLILERNKSLEKKIEMLNVKLREEKEKLSLKENNQSYKY